MTEPTTRYDGGPAYGASAPRLARRRLIGTDIYTVRARIAPALLASLPLISLGLVALPWLEQTEKLWSLVGLGVTTFAALAARRAGNRAQPKLYRAWGGTPTTMRLRYRSETSPHEISRRHRHVERVLGNGLRLPTAEAEASDPVTADQCYADAARRILPLVRNNPEFKMLNIENRNYGFARNLLGLRPIGVTVAIVTLVLTSVVAGTLLYTEHGVTSAAPMLLPAALSAAALALWPIVDQDFVRPSAEAYADRVVEALDDLPGTPSSSG